jgi:integrase
VDDYGRAHEGREQRVPLNDAALAILRPWSEASTADKVFPISNMAMLMLLRRMGRGDLTAHGFRNTFRDCAAECTNFPAEVAEMALANTVGDKLEAAYRRGDLFEKRREIMAAWANFIDHDKAAMVVPMRGGG